MYGKAGLLTKFKALIETSIAGLLASDEVHTIPTLLHGVCDKRLNERCAESIPLKVWMTVHMKMSGVLHVPMLKGFKIKNMPI